MAGYMSIQAEGGIEVYCLPPVAWCKCAKKDIEDMDECPMRYFDPEGEICRPDLCEFYTEDASDVKKEEEE